MAAPTVVGRIIHRRRAEKTGRGGALRFPEPAPTPTECRARFPVRGVLTFGGPQS